MLVDGVPDWPQDLQVLGTEGRAHFLVFPQGGDRLRLTSATTSPTKRPMRGRAAGPSDRDVCRPSLPALRRRHRPGRPIGPFNAVSNEDHWVEDPTAPGVVLVGDAAGHNDPILGQGLSIALRDVRLASEAILAGGRDQAAFRPYVEERLERMRRLRITASLQATLRAEYGEEARRRRQRAGRRMRVDMMLAPFPASLVGPDKLPAAAFDQATIDALLAP